MESKLKVGDKVVLKNMMRTLKDDTSFNTNWEMLEYLGKEVTIKDIVVRAKEGDEEEVIFKIEEDGGAWYWNSYLHLEEVNNIQEERELMIAESAKSQRGITTNFMEAIEVLVEGRWDAIKYAHSDNDCIWYDKEDGVFKYGTTHMESDMMTISKSSEPMTLHVDYLRGNCWELINDEYRREMLKDYRSMKLKEVAKKLKNANCISDSEYCILIRMSEVEYINR